MNKYALILLDDYSDEMLNGVNYPVCIDYGKWKMLEYNDEPDPIGDWLIFEGEDSNLQCSQYLKSQIN